MLINLAIGNFTIKDARNYLSFTVPMNLQTGIQEAGLFAYNPGQVISYQVGKLQILNIVAEAKVLPGRDFDLKRFHDYLMIYGNVPIALLR